MKNLLLLFVLGFALFWVGCEKEEIVIPASAEMTQQQYMPNTDEAVVEANALHNPPQSSETLDCCEIGSPIKLFHLDQSQRVLYTYPFKTSEVGMGSRVIQRIYVNGAFYEQTSIFSSDNCDDEFGVGYINYSDLGECPDRIRIEARLQYFDGGWITCDTRELKRNDNYVYNLSYSPPCPLTTDPDDGPGF